MIWPCTVYNIRQVVVPINGGERLVVVERHDLTSAHAVIAPRPGAQPQCVTGIIKIKKKKQLRISYTGTVDARNTIVLGPTVSALAGLGFYIQ